MEKTENLNESELVELWQELQSMTQEETRDCGDVALLWHLAERLDLVNILDQALGQSLSKEMKDQALGQSLSKEMKDQAADKREQGESAGLLTVPRVREDRLDGYSSRCRPRKQGVISGMVSPDYPARACQVTK